MINIQRLKDEFINIVKENIHRDGIDNLMNYLESTDFYRSPASTRYHGSYAGGLLEHSLNVYYSLIDELQFIYGKDWEQRYSKESVAIVSLFHDICKISRYKPSVRNVKDPVTKQWNEQAVYVYNENYVNMGHGAKSIYLLQKYMNLTEDEATAVFWHMGAFDVGNYNTIGDLSNCYKSNTLAFALHRADMLSTFVVENEQFKPLSLDE